MKNKTVKLQLEGNTYILDVEQALAMDVLKHIPAYPLQLGDVYVHPTGDINPFLLIQVTYDGGNVSTLKPRFQLLGISGVKPNFGEFFNSVHSMDEIRKYLISNGMIYSHNISTEIDNLVHKFH